MAADASPTEQQLATQINTLPDNAKDAVAKAATVLYLNDSSDYINGLWDVMRALLGTALVEADDFTPELAIKLLNKHEEE